MTFMKAQDTFGYFRFHTIALVRMGGALAWVQTQPQEASEWTVRTWTQGAHGLTFSMGRVVVAFGYDKAVR